MTDKDDIYEELDFVQPHKKISVNLQLCEDAISRESVINIVRSLIAVDLRSWQLAITLEEIEQLPSVTPSIKEWLSSFNTDSATDCFTAVQRLKEAVYENKIT